MRGHFLAFTVRKEKNEGQKEGTRPKKENKSWF
jgi:hypothetical protein